MLDHDTALSNDSPMAAKYRETIQAHVYKGPNTGRVGMVLMIMQRRHPSFRFVTSSADVRPGDLSELGVLVHAIPEKLPSNYGEEFIEVLRDKLVEIREEFAFGVNIMKAIQG